MALRRAGGLRRRRSRSLAAKAPRLANAVMALPGVAIIVGLLALIPVVGFVEAVVLPVLAARRARQSPDKYAGLRSLAK